jgi:amidohydrolase
MKARRISSCKRSLNSSWTSSLVFVALLAAATTGSAQSPLHRTIDERAAALEQEMLGWRRHFHEHPELSNREVETSKYVAERLRSFGLDPKVGVGRHGVVATLRGAQPGPVVALRADMDALPVKEESGLPFASTATGEFEGRNVPVMHACGHDAHMAMLLAAAKILSGLQAQLHGTVKFIFQPAEEGAPASELPAGADLMVREGALKSPDVDAVFGVHVFANIPSGHIGYRSGPLMAASDQYEIIVRGRQTHGANPWNGVDPIVVGSQVVLGLQTIVSRQVDITAQPAIITVGQFESGVRNNIIPDSARLVGTIRTFDEAMRKDVHERITRTAQRIAESAGATATVSFGRYTPVTVNNPALTRHVLPTLQRVTNNVFEVPLFTTAEDFSFYQHAVPGVFVFLGITPPDQVGKADANHAPRFMVDERALVTGVRTLSYLAVDYLASPLK